MEQATDTLAFTADQSAVHALDGDGEAALASVSAYLNALLREWDGWQIFSAQKLGLGSDQEEVLALPLAKGQQLYIALTGRTAFRYGFALPFLFQAATGPINEISVTEALTKLVLDPVASPGKPDLQKLLLSRVLDSLIATKQAVVEGPAFPADPREWTFQQAEHALAYGHPTHPNPRSRDELSPEEARLYAPELGGRYALFWSLIHRDLLALVSGTATPVEEMCRAMVASDDHLAPLQEALVGKEDFVPVPWHPWQANKLLVRPEVIAAIGQGQFIPFGPLGQPFGATASFRGAQAFHAPYMLKFSLSLRLTNSTRVLAAKEVERGVQLATLLSGDFATLLSTEFPAVSILKEPGSLALKDREGQVIEESFVVLRDNPFQDPTKKGPIALASLCEFKPAGQCPLVVLIRALATQQGRAVSAVAQDWLTAFVQRAILPILEIRARHGLLFGAHQQNMMIELSGGMPAKLWLRDCQGTGHLTTHHDHLAAYLPDIGAHAENVVDPELGDGLLSYYVVVNNLMNLVSALVLHDLLAEAEAYALVRAEVMAAKDCSRGDVTYYDKLLTGETLVTKGNYRTSLSNVNEASGDGNGQLAAFFNLPNPFAI